MAKGEKQDSGGFTITERAKVVRGTTDSLRHWSDHSYDVSTGRSASSIEGPGDGSRGNHTTNVETQVSAALGRAEGRNNPGVTAMNKSGSGDPGRRKWGATEGNM